MSDYGSTEDILKDMDRRRRQAVKEMSLRLAQEALLRQMSLTPEHVQASARRLAEDLAKFRD